MSSNFDTSALGKQFKTIKLKIEQKKFVEFEKIVIYLRN